MTNKKINSERKKDLVLALAILGAFLSFVFLVATLYNTDHFYKNVKVAGIDLSGKTRTEAEAMVNQKTRSYPGVLVGNETVLPAKVGVNFDTGRTLDKAYAFGRNPNIFLGLKERFLANFKEQDFPLEMTVGDGFQKYLLSQADKTSIKVGKSTISWQNGLKYQAGNAGRRLLITDTKIAMLSFFGKLESGQTLKTEAIAPEFALSNKKIAALEAKLKTSVNLNYEDKSWQITPQEMTGWISLERSDNQGVNSLLWPEISETGTVASVNPAEVGYYVSNLASQIDVPVQNALLKVENGRAVAFSPSVEGRELDQGDAKTQIMAALNGNTRNVTLKVDKKTPAITESNINDLGIKELVAVGTSNFSGSPANRIHNVKTGASKFNGVMIEPGAEFSFNTILGPVEASTGYTQELVILKDKTVPEYGGGLCQVSTTAFRAALNGGFPILERANHAYPVTYYYPIGTDATIYLPKPDFRFKNDTPGHLLVQTSVSGNVLKFEFYGTKTSRTVKFGGSADGNGAVDRVESIKPYFYNQGKTGKGSVDSLWYRFLYEDGKLTKTDKFVSHYDSPDKYPH